MKRVFALLLVICLIALLVACSNNNQLKEKNDLSNNYTEHVSETKEPTEKETEKPTEDEKTTVSKSISYKIANQNNYQSNHAFNNGIAWIMLSDNSDNKTMALVNTAKEILYLEAGHFKDNSKIISTDFVNGLSALYSKNESSIVVVNNKGEEVFVNTDEDISFCGQADDGYFFFRKHYSGYDHDYWVLCILDPQLQFTETEIEPPKESEYVYRLTQGVYYFSSRYFLNLNLNVCFEDRNDKIKYVGKNEEYVFANKSHIPVDLLQSIDSVEAYSDVLNNEDVIKYDEDESNSKSEMKEWNAGSFYRHYYKKDLKEDIYEYVDIYGNNIFAYPIFFDGMRYSRIDDFSGDFSAVFFNGKDSKKYLTIIDGDGKEKYEPIQYDSYYSCDSCNGYIFFYNSGICDIIAPDGTHKNLGNDLSGLANTNAVLEDCKMAIGDGYIFLWGNGDQSLSYISIDGKTRITSFSANYNKNGDLVYTDQDGKKAINPTKSTPNSGSSESEQTDKETKVPTETNSTVQETVIQKNYTNPSSYNIVGKWKNVGEGTYGQAQKGAIVIFDGTNCNFFSPKDTYAFYKDGNDFRLDCTSPLADTVSFTVKIVDNNNIDIVNKYVTVELTRVN